MALRLLPSLLCVALVGNDLAAVRGQEPLLRDGDRVVWLGDGFWERMQQHGYLETSLLVRQPAWKLRFRNLGWSGDTVGGLSRAVFGGPEEGFQRLENDLRLADPTVVVLAYGNNEAHQGRAGLDAFREEAERLLRLISDLQARLIVVAPRRYEENAAYRVYPDAYNRELVAYRAALQQLSQQHGGAWLPWDAFQAGPLTDDGVQFSPMGYRVAAQWLADQLLGRSNEWTAEINVVSGDSQGRGVELGQLKRIEGEYVFDAVADRLPDPAPPELEAGLAPPAAIAPVGLLTITGLPSGRYELLLGDEVLHAATARQWEAGQPLQQRAGGRTTEAIRQLTIAKDELFFHRYRPQNETYLFLFRKHEQGNNAVEVPQFERLTAAKEAEIDPLRSPTTATYRLRAK